MIKREEAINALQKIESLHAYESDIDDELKTLFAFANQPTLDDAIKVVEKHHSILEPHRHIDVCAPYALSELDDLITALKGLKGE